MKRRSAFRVAAPEGLDPTERWEARGACRTEENRAQADNWYAPSSNREAFNAAMRVCAGCPVRAECLDAALKRREAWGIWGGLTESQRRGILRKRQASAEQQAA
ncbi:WhiB family transcriptional regulator [Streptomyces sp. NPDC016845]|uniref:WhiB family transcriptional regulator n=1 Tax=Streptomyces sp. NPDC016845 TaxID=3364972 RepID=UPI0037989E56